MLAVWALLKELYPNAFKRTVDQTDPASVWALNLDDLTVEQMNVGMRVLGRSEAQFMPNAPAVRRMFLSATREALSESSPADTDMWGCLRGHMWMDYSKHVILSGRGKVSFEQAETCCRLAKEVTAPFERAWSEEKGATQELWTQVSRSAANALIRQWNEVVGVAGVEYEDLFR